MFCQELKLAKTTIRNLEAELSRIISFTLLSVITDYTNAMTPICLLEMGASSPMRSFLHEFYLPLFDMVLSVQTNDHVLIKLLLILRFITHKIFFFSFTVFKAKQNIKLEPQAFDRTP